VFKPALNPLRFHQSEANNSSMAALRPDFSTEDAEFLAVRALGFLAEDSERLEQFLSLTGISVDTLKRDAGNPAVLTAILDHLLKDESLLLTFAANSGTDPANVARAHRRLEYGDRSPG
jgi:hypothetical protein